MGKDFQHERSERLRKSLGIETPAEKEKRRIAELRRADEARREAAKGNALPLPEEP